ncbi:unnamed protein product [Peniophora sp. CBMAI 1063]|nr:unnamed protein product [Peniophora sp. CBMAI 1063]
MTETKVDNPGEPRQGTSDVPVEGDRASAGDRPALGHEPSAPTVGSYETEHTQGTALEKDLYGGGDEGNSSDLESSGSSSESSSEDDSGYRSRGPPKHPVNGLKGAVKVKDKPKPKPDSKDTKK